MVRGYSFSGSWQRHNVPLRLTGLCPVPEAARAAEWFWAQIEYNFPMFWYVYVLLSNKDNNFYIGSTTDLERRIKEHQQGKNVSTSKRLPLALIYFEGHRSKDDALRREKYFKTTKGRVTLKQVLQHSLAESESSKLAE